ncbi:MAG TPA: M1 family aminopeptidase [Pyrinomonadaceae bacterium]|nr:hypothetical protein [Chloracidobacterium sp.]HRJ88790.1 M1 family aminopeptidase [Pyrinomonadaceae bacterium]HRK48937.1 M1 family aminopeptidase [Pyrinomonadaceae bacterium]
MAKHNLKKMLLPAVLLTAYISAFAQPLMAQPLATPDAPPIEPGVSLTLAKWRAERYSDVRYKLNLTLEKMSPLLKGTMEVRVRVAEKGSWGVKESVPPAVSGGGTAQAETRPVGSVPHIVLDWRKIKGHEEKSTISNVSVNGRPVTITSSPPATVGGTDMSYSEENEHLIFYDNVVIGENVIKLDFTSPILTSGSAITRYVDKEDGSEYIYSLFVPSDASTAFPVFDQPDLKARFTLTVRTPFDWLSISNTDAPQRFAMDPGAPITSIFEETKPISTYVFAFAAGPFEKVTGGNLSGREGVSSPPNKNTLPTGRVSASGVSSPHVSKGSTSRNDNVEPLLTVGLQTPETSIYVRKSQAAKFKPHAAEVFRLNREAVKYFEEYFDYKFPFSKYDLVLIPEFPFGGMEHAGATFLRESAIIFPQEPTKNDHISRALLIFHEASHQWFGDTVTMRWFDDLWLKEGFATFTAYKAMEKTMSEMNAWKVFYERVKQAAYQTDSTKGTTPIYQEIPNLSAAKSAYGNIVYNKAPAFLRQAEFYLGEDKFQTAVRAFLKKYEFGNAGWEDLVKEFGTATNSNLTDWARTWVKQSGLPTFRLCIEDYSRSTKLTGRPGEITLLFSQTGFPCYPRTNRRSNASIWPEGLQFYYVLANGKTRVERVTLGKNDREIEEIWGYNFGDLASKSTRKELEAPKFIQTNYGDYGYGIFLLDEKSREYVLKNIQNEEDPFLRSMMWGALWDSVREGELDPREYVELVVKVLQRPTREQGLNAQAGSKALTDVRASAIDDESTTALLLNRIGTAMNYYIEDGDGVRSPHVSKGSRSSTGRVEPSLTASTPRGDAPAGTPGVGLRTRVEDLLIERMKTSETLGQRITYYRAFLNIAASEKARGVLKELLAGVGSPHVSNGSTLSTGRVEPSLTVGLLTLRTKDRFDIVARLLILGDSDAPKLLAELEKTETSDDAKRYAYAARAGIATAENKAKYWKDFTENKEISESWIEAAFGPWNSIRHSELTSPYLQKALQELPNHKRNRKIFFVNGWLGAFIGGQRSEEALNIINKFLADNPSLDRDLHLKILENADIIERAVKIRKRWNAQ